MKQRIAVKYNREKSKQIAEYLKELDSEGHSIGQLIELWLKIFECLGDEFSDDVLSSEIKEKFDSAFDSLRLQKVDFNAREQSIFSGLESKFRKSMSTSNTIRWFLLIFGTVTVLVGALALLVLFTPVIPQTVALVYWVGNLVTGFYAPVISYLSTVYYPFIFQNLFAISVGSSVVAFGLFFVFLDKSTRFNLSEIGAVLLSLVLCLAVCSSPLWLVPALSFVPLALVGFFALVAFVVMAGLLVASVIGLVHAIWGGIRISIYVTDNTFPEKAKEIMTAERNKLEMSIEQHSLKKGFEKQLFIALRDYGALIAKGIASGHKDTIDFLSAIVAGHNDERSTLTAPTVKKIEKVYDLSAKIARDNPLSENEQKRLEHIINLLEMSYVNYDETQVYVISRQVDAREQRIALDCLKWLKDDSNFAADVGKMLDSKRSSIPEAVQKKSDHSNPQDIVETSKGLVMATVQKYGHLQFFRTQVGQLLAPEGEKAVPTLPSTGPFEKTL